MKRIVVVLILMAIVLAVAIETGQTIPAFARKYGFNCNMCHTSFTKLNDFGQRVRDYGYQIPGQEGYEKNVFETTVPFQFEPRPV